MAKFKKGDRVRCVSDVTADVHIGKVYLVDGYEDGRVYFKDDAGCDRHRSAYRYELATPSTIPDTVTIDGVEYVRKPEREFKYGDWVKTHDKKTVGFVLGHNYNKVACAFNDGEISWYSAHELTYISTATVPE